MQKNDNTNNLLLSYAYDNKRKLTHIDNAHKDNKYTCPNCGAELILKISKIPKGQKYYRRNHFAHKGNADNHCSESFLHKLFKDKCAELLRIKISNNEEVLFEWKCEKCHEIHKGNLLKKAIKAVTEYDLGICKPDIALLDCNNNVVIVIEVIVTHEPEPNVIQYYNENNIACLQIRVNDFIDCDSIEHKLSRPDRVNLCPNPICEKCGHSMYKSKIVTMVIKCPICDKQTKLGYIVSSREICEPNSFYKHEIPLAIKLGANIDYDIYNSDIFSIANNKPHLANICAFCNTEIKYWEIMNFDLPPYTDEINIGYRCFNCITLEQQAKAEAKRQKEMHIIKLKNSEGSKMCPKCGGILKVRKGMYGHFWGCINYPDCKYIENIKDL